MKMKIELGKRYFLRMRPVRSLPFIGLGFTSSNDPDPWVECEVVENRIPSSSKVTLQAILDGFGKEEFYRLDFDSLVKSGHIIEKTREDQHVEFVRWNEPLTPTVCVEHSGFIVV